jgi:nucleotide-binding universal stress UspA family protein
MKILIAADGSKFTRAAARFVARQARQMKTTPDIHLLHVHAPLPYPGAAGTVGRQAVKSYQRDESRKALAVAEKELARARLDYTSSWVVGNAAEQIARYAKKQGVDVIVTGSHGHGALASLALGSVATRLVAISKVPVLIVPRN